jgi:hypothetical protein
MYYSDGSSKLWEVLQKTRKAMFSSDDEAINTVCGRKDFGTIETVTLDCSVPVIFKNTAVVLFGGNQILLKAYAKCGEYEHKIDTNFSSSFPKPLSCYFNAVREGTLAWKFVGAFFTRLSESNIPAIKKLSTTFIQRIHNDMPTALAEVITGEDHNNTNALIIQLESEKKRMSMNSPRITQFKGPENFTHEDFSSDNSGQQDSPRIPRKIDFVDTEEKIDFVDTEDVSGRCGIAEVTLREYLQKQSDVDLSDDIELEAIVYTIHDMNCIFIRENEFGLKFNDKLDTKDKIHMLHYASDTNNGDSGPDIDYGPNIDESGPDISGNVDKSTIDYAKIAGKGKYIEVRLSPTNVARKRTTLEDECRKISGFPVSEKNNAIANYAQKLLSSENVGYNIQISLTAVQTNSSLIASDGMCGLHTYFWAYFTSIGAHKIAAEWAYLSVQQKYRHQTKHKLAFLKKLSDLLGKAAFLEDILGFLISKGKGKCVSAEDINNILISSTKFGEDPLFMSYFSTQFLSVSSLTIAVEDLKGLIKKLKTYENFITSPIPPTLAMTDWLSDKDMTLLFLIGNVKAILYVPLSGHY